MTLAACSSTSSVQHSPAQFTPIVSTRMVDGEDDMVRQRLISRLPAAGFTVVEIDDASNVIHVSLITDQPGDYVDCGRTLRTFEGAWGGEQVFDYEPAAGSTYKLTSYEGDPLQATRDVVLDATATVQIAPAAGKTEVRVDASYDLETHVTYSDGGWLAFAADDADTVDRVIRFDSNRPGVGDGEVALCMSTGRLEAQILELAT